MQRKIFFLAEQGARRELARMCSGRYFVEVQLIVSRVAEVQLFEFE